MTCTRSATPSFAASSVVVARTARARRRPAAAPARARARASARIATSVRLIGVWKPNEPSSGASPGMPRARRKARPRSRIASGGSGIPIGTTRTASRGSSSASRSAAQLAVDEHAALAPRAESGSPAARTAPPGRTRPSAPAAPRRRRSSRDRARARRGTARHSPCPTVRSSRKWWSTRSCSTTTPGRSAASSADRGVVAVVAHLVERQPAVLARRARPARGPVARARSPSSSGRSGSRSTRTSARAAQVRQEVDRVVGDARADRRQRREVVETERHRGHSSRAAPAVGARAPARARPASRRARGGR